METRHFYGPYTEVESYLNVFAGNRLIPFKKYVFKRHINFTDVQQYLEGFTALSDILKV